MNNPRRARSSVHAQAGAGRGIEFSRAGLGAAEIWCRGERLRALYHLGEWVELEQEASEVLSWVEQRGGGQLAVFAHVELAQLLVHRGELAIAAKHVDALLPRARESGDPQVLVPGLMVAALVAWRGANDRDAFELVSEIEEKTREAPLGWRSTICLTWPARIAIAAGSFELLGIFLEGSEQASAWDACARPAALAGLAEARGQLEEAAELYRRAAERWGEFGSVVEQAYALLGLGRCGDAKADLEGKAIFARLGASPVLAKAA
jgi:tetratricopeptide (TPR) repeat protein